MKKIKNPASFTLPKCILHDWTAFVNVAGFFIMILTCVFCGNGFKTSHSDRKHCSKDCMANAYKVSLTGNLNPNWKGGIPEKICNHCGKNYLRYATNYKQKYCSRKCADAAKAKNKVLVRHPNLIAALQLKAISAKAKKICACGNKKESTSVVCFECRKKHWKTYSVPLLEKKCPQCNITFVTKIVAKVFCSMECSIAFKAENSKGSKNPNWRGGVKKESAKIRSTEEYKKWRTAVFERDKYTCVKCGQVGGKLNADHIKQFAYHPELRFDITNGRTLCVECHKKTDTYLHKGIQRKIYST